MKNLLIIVLTLFILFSSCIRDRRGVKKYEIVSVKFVPDSLKVAHREWITKTISAASYHMSAGKYKHVKATIVQAERTGNRLFEVYEEGLRICGKGSDFCRIIDIPFSKLDSTQKQIFYSLKQTKN